MANQIKIKRYESIILDVVNKTITYEVKNKYPKMARATYAKLTNDLSQCEVFVDTYDRDHEAKIVEELNKISGLFRSKVCEALDIYKTPKIIFKQDKTIQYAENIDKIIKSIK